MGKKRGEVSLSPRGYVPFLVGTGEKEKFLVHITSLKHPHIRLLLDMSAREFGYDQKGIITIPCDADYFRKVFDSLYCN